uniref:ATP-dependent Clp protease proteolytic subunit n=1 Tax=Chenopodium quinoa TaxID=63459 RepID=A0A803LDT4_CHEQI
MVAASISTYFTCSSIASQKTKTSPFPLLSQRSSNKSIVSVLSNYSSDYSSISGLSSKSIGLPLKPDQSGQYNSTLSNGPIEARKGNPPVLPAVMTPGGPLDLSSVLFRNRIIFIGQPVNSQVAQRVISQLVTLATIDENSDILMYLNCPGGSTYSVLGIYDCMSWNTGKLLLTMVFSLSDKAKSWTVCFGVAASQGALLLAGGEKGMRYAMPNSRVMIHQPQSGCGGHVEDVRRQVNEAVQSRHCGILSLVLIKTFFLVDVLQKIDKMYAAFTGQPLEKVQQYTERDRFLSVTEAMEFGLIDGILETEY